MKLHLYRGGSWYPAFLTGQAAGGVLKGRTAPPPAALAVRLQTCRPYRAALVEYEHVGVYSCRSIHVETTPVRLLKEVAPVVLGFAQTLVDFFREEIDREVLRLLFDPDGECPLFDECHSCDDIVPLLRHMARIHEGILADCPPEQTILGKWYDALVFINEVWLCVNDTYLPGNYIRVFLEADLPTFLTQLLDNEAGRFNARLVLVESDEERFEAIGRTFDAWELDEGNAVNLGQLAVLANAEDWQNQATIRTFWKWVDRFNEDNEG